MQYLWRQLSAGETSMRTVIAAAILVASVTSAQAQYYGYGSGSNSRSHSVGGYTNSHGTYVDSYQRTNPNSTQMDNFGTRGNYNSYNGSYGTRGPRY